MSIANWIKTYRFRKAQKALPLLPETHFVSNTHLVVKCDGIGDYILCRNFFEILKEKWGPLSLCANQAVKDLALALDSDLFEQCIWIDRPRFTNDLNYHLQCLSQIHREFKRVIQPTYSRTFFEGDSLVWAAQSKQKIGFEGDLNNSDKWTQNLTDSFYTQLVKTPKDTLFEFDRNKLFFETILGQPINMKAPLIEPLFPLSKQFILLFPSTGSPYRNWSIEYFLKLEDKLKQQHQTVVWVLNPHFQVSLPPTSHVFQSESLLQSLKLLHQAKAVVCGDTGLFHMSAALNIPTVCISNGNHRGRFHPYPENMEKPVKMVYHPKAHTLPLGSHSALPMKDITPERVLEALKAFL